MKEPGDAGGVLNFHQGSGGMNIHICKNIMCRSVHTATYTLSK